MSISPRLIRLLGKHTKRRPPCLADKRTGRIPLMAALRPVRYEWWAPRPIRHVRGYAHAKGGIMKYMLLVYSAEVDWTEAEGATCMAESTEFCHQLHMRRLPKNSSPTLIL